MAECKSTLASHDEGIKGTLALGGANKKQNLPLAVEELPTVSVGATNVFSVGDAEVKEDLPLYRRHKHAFICCEIVVGLVVVLGIVILIISFTFFKTKQPVITIDNVVLENLNIGAINLSNIDAAVRFTLSLDVTVFNPNHVSFRYTNSTSYMFYHSAQVGEASIPSGRIGARGTENLSTTVQLVPSSVITNPNFPTDFGRGIFPITTTAEVSGSLNVLNIFKHHAKSFSYCSLFVSVAMRSVQNLTCEYHDKL